MMIFRITIISHKEIAKGCLVGQIDFIPGIKKPASVAGFYLI